MPGPVDPREVEAMARLRRIMSGEVEQEQSPALLSTKKVQLGESADATDDMKAILELFNKGAQESVERVREEAKDSKPLRDALMTQKTKDGVKMGSWEIKVHEDGGLKTYDVSNVYTGEAIAQDLTLYESALCLCKLLNFHVGINSSQVKEILNLEEQYARQRQEAAIFKVRVKQRTEAGDHTRAAIAEDRYNEARSQALDLREQIVARSKTL